MRIYIGLAALVLIAVAVAAGCRNTAIKTVKTDEPVTIKIGQTARVDDGALELTLLPEINDSRCASDVQCIRAGEVVVRVNVKRDGQDVAPFTFAVPSGPYTNVQFIGPYRIELKDVQPYPNSKKQTKPEDYRATFTVEKN